VRSAVLINSIHALHTPFSVLDGRKQLDGINKSYRMFKKAGVLTMKKPNGLVAQ